MTAIVTFSRKMHQTNKKNYFLPLRNFIHEYNTQT